MLRFRVPLLALGVLALTGPSLLAQVSDRGRERQRGDEPPAALQDPRIDPQPPATTPGRPVPPARPTRPADRPDTLGTTYTGTLVSAGAAQLVVADAAGKEHLHSLSATAQVLLNGRKAVLSDLRPGMNVEVTVRPTEPKVAVRVLARVTLGSD